MRLTICLLLLIAHAASAQTPAATERLRLHGSNTIGERMAPALAEAWLRAEGFDAIERMERAFEEVEVSGVRGTLRRTVEIHAHGSSTGFRGLAAGSADIAMSSRPAQPADNPDGALGRLDAASQEVVIALDGLAIIVHPSNPLRELGKAQVRAVFAGQITRWSELGIRGGRIALHARDDRSGTWESFRSLVLGADPLSPAALRYESTAQLAAAVGADPDAIGFVGLAGVDGVRSVAIADGGAAVAPRREEVAVEDYPLSRRLYLYLPATATPLAGAFVDFALGAQGQAQVERSGFVSQDIRAYAAAVRPDAPGEYRVLVAGARRLSLNFRFDSGNAQLDSKGQRDLDRLAAFLREPGQRGLPLLLLGFADADETLPYLALALSNDRVDDVADRLLTRGIAPARARGMGGTAPVSANDSAQGRLRNRRVEVWLGGRDAEPPSVAAGARR